MATDDHMKVTAVGLPSGALSATFGRYELENGQHIEDVVLGYSTYGTLNEVRLPLDDALFPPENARYSLFALLFDIYSPRCGLRLRRRALTHHAPSRDANPRQYRPRSHLHDRQTGDNAVIVGHSLTSNSNVSEWWRELMGEGDACALDVANEFVVCVNYLASPYGSSSPVTPDPAKPNGDAYAADFPTPVTVRDNVRLQRLLLDRLGVKHLKMAIGGSMGSMLALEWAATFPDFVTELVLIAGCGRHTDWAIGIGEAQRFSIMADAKFKGGQYDPADPPLAGLATSRMMAMLSYRAPKSVDERFARGVMETVESAAEKDREKNEAAAGVKVEGRLGGTLVADRSARSTAMRKPSSHGDIGLAAHANESASETLPYFAVESYLQYQGKKFIQRFDANCYIQLTYTLDSHDVARGRGAYEDVLRRLTHRTLVVGITSDVLYPFSLQSELADLMPNAEMYAIDSPHGHDAFLIEIRELNKAIARFRRGERADPDAARVASRFPGGAQKSRAPPSGGVAPSSASPSAAAAATEEQAPPTHTSLRTLHDGELRGAVRALERELEKSRAREERHARRADALLAEVARLRDEAEAAKTKDPRGEDGVAPASSFGYGLRLVPANPPPSSRRYQPVYGEVKSPANGAEAPIAALGAF